jgi:hypothetical protein
MYSVLSLGYSHAKQLSIDDLPAWVHHALWIARKVKDSLWEKQKDLSYI